eukprot:55149-Chlamydomonas_euryale.AAC.5
MRNSEPHSRTSRGSGDNADERLAYGFLLAPTRLPATSTGVCYTACILHGCCCHERMHATQTYTAMHGAIAQADAPPAPRHPAVRPPRMHSRAPGSRPMPAPAAGGTRSPSLPPLAPAPATPRPPGGQHRVKSSSLSRFTMTGSKFDPFDPPFLTTLLPARLPACMHACTPPPTVHPRSDHLPGVQLLDERFQVDGGALLRP